MKKRLKNKRLKKSNMFKQENILKEIAKHFKIRDKRFGNGYFIFSMGENAVCHFELVETPGWLYGIWLRDKQKYVVFGEHEDLVDKFKPSRTYVSCENDVSAFIEMVYKIKENPKLYFVDSLTSGDALVAFEEEEINDEKYYSGYQKKRLFNDKTKLWDIVVRDETITQESFVEKEYREFYEEKEEKSKNSESDRKYAFNFFKELPNLDEDILAIGVLDRNKKGWICSPRYDIWIVLKPELSQEDFAKKFYEIDELINNKNHHDDRKTYDHQFSLSDGYDEVSDIKSCDYKFYKTA